MMLQTHRWLLPLLPFLSFVSPAPAAGIPAGLEVRIGDSPLSGKLIGRTPVVVAAADVGRFVTATLLRKEYGEDLPAQGDLGDFSARTSHSAVNQVDGKEEDYLRAIVAEVTAAGVVEVIDLASLLAAPRTPLPQRTP